VHDAFLALWRAPEAYDPARGPFRSFFLALVHHRAVDTVRREDRLRKRTERASNLEPVRGEDVAEDVVEESFLSVRRLEVREALQTLPAEQRQVLEMAYFQGKTQVSIAEELGIPLGTVKTRTLAAMRKLRRELYRED
jgi:RNA polymerase sigma-70 factor, ECF subfamily